MDRKKLIAASEGENARTGGMNVPEIREYLIEMKVDTRARINKLRRSDLQILLKSLLQDSKVDTIKEISIQELFLSLTSLDVNTIEIIEKYLSNEIKLLYELGNKEVLKENNDAKISLESKKAIEGAPALDELKSNKYFTFHDGSLNYALVLKAYESIFNNKDEDVNMKNLLLYFDVINATSITIYSSRSGFEYVFKYGDIVRYIYSYVDSDYLFKPILQINTVINSVPKFKHLKELCIRIENSEWDDWNEGLIQKENDLPDLENWQYLQQNKSILVDDIKKELPISCKRFDTVNLTGFTPNYLKHVEVLICYYLPTNNNQLKLIESMQNLKVFGYRDENVEVDDENFFNILPLYLDHKEGKTEKIVAKIEQLENELKELKNLEISSNEDNHEELVENKVKRITSINDYIISLQNETIFETIDEISEEDENFKFRIELYLLSVRKGFKIEYVDI
jgi:hypothetical protein